MTHFPVIVALTKEDLERSDGDVKAAVAAQLEPFSEGGEWFKDGSRWDWWVIGGRFSDRFAIGANAVLVSQLDPAARIAKARAGAAACWAEASARWEKEGKRSEAWDSIAYGINPDDTEETLIERWAAASATLHASAFVVGRTWNEANRSGWFGTTIETAQAMTGDIDERQVLNSNVAERGCAAIVAWPNGDWRAEFERRFIAGLAADTTLVCVDCHV